MDHGSSKDEGKGEPHLSVHVEVASTVKTALSDMRPLVFLDHSKDGRYTLTNVVTTERLVLAEGDWDLVFAEDGLGASLLHLKPNADTEAEPECFDIRAYLRREIFHAPNGERFQVIFDDNGDVRNAGSWDDALSKHKEAKLSDIMLGSTTSKHHIPLFVLQHPRGCGSRVFWSIMDIYDFLGLDTYKNRRSKWVWDSLATWRDASAKSFNCDLVIFSRHGNGCDSGILLNHWFKRCLPKVSLGTHMFLVLLCRWSFLKKERGGLGKEDHKSAALA
jgi:hypothetical protein